jgi:hypothetical protein
MGLVADDEWSYVCRSCLGSYGLTLLSRRRKALAHERDLAVELVYDCIFGWFARKGHPLAGRRRLTIDDLAAYPLISVGYADPSIARRMAQLYGWTLPLEERFAISTNHVSTVHTLVSASDAITPTTDVSMVAGKASGRAGARPGIDARHRGARAARAFLRRPSAPSASFERTSRPSPGSFRFRARKRQCESGRKGRCAPPVRRYCLLTATDQIIFMFQRRVADLWRQCADGVAACVDWTQRYLQ